MVMMDSGSISSSVSILFARAAVLVPEVPVYMYVVCWETHFAASSRARRVAWYTGGIIYSTIN